MFIPEWIIIAVVAYLAIGGLGCAIDPIKRPAGGLGADHRALCYAYAGRRTRYCSSQQSGTLTQ